MHSLHLTDVLAAFSETVVEYNQSPLAKNGGWTYRPSAWTLLQIQETVATLPAGGTFIDVGTGMAIVPRTLQKLGYKVITIDSPDASGTAAADNAGLAGIRSYLAHVGRDELPLEASVADAIGAFDVIEHLADTPRPFLSAVRRLLKPSGKLLLSTPNATRVTARIKMLLGYSNWPAVKDYLDTEKNFFHHHEYTRSELVQTLRSCGFAVDALHLHEARLGQIGVDSFQHLDSQRRAAGASSSFMINVGSRFLSVIVSVCPRLRSEMLAVASKLESRKEVPL